MRKIIFLLINISFLNLTISSQSASIGSDFGFLETKTHNDPKKKWPECEAPVAYFEAYNDGFTLIIEDYDDNLIYQMSETSETKSEVRNLQKNEAITYKKVPEDFRLRIKCKEDLYSEWTVITRNDACDCNTLFTQGDARAKVVDQCLYIVWEDICFDQYASSKGSRISINTIPDYIDLSNPPGPISDYLIPYDLDIDGPFKFRIPDGELYYGSHFIRYRYEHCTERPTLAEFNIADYGLLPCGGAVTSCANLNYDISSSSITEIVEGIEVPKCVFDWSFPIGLESGLIQNQAGGNQISLSGNGGSVLLLEGDYVMSFEYQDENGVIRQCDDFFELTCSTEDDPILPDDEIDNLIPCSLMNISYSDISTLDGEIVNCKINWSVQEGFDLTVEFVNIASGSIQTFAANSGEFHLGNTDWILNYTLSYDHPEHGIIFNECALDLISCPEQELDTDRDGFPDSVDNCPLIPNSDQNDTDGDGIGDVCELDTDGDGVIDDNDNCPYVPNPTQTDLNTNGIGDVCESTTDNDDVDNDGISNDQDNCPMTPNPDQTDTDGDGIGNACEADSDGDGIIDDNDNCVYTFNIDQKDTDGDGIGDVCDVEIDSDGDGVSDSKDNCPSVPNPDQADLDGDGIGDACEADSDGDGVIDDNDNCPYVPNPDQYDYDMDGIGDPCDPTFNDDVDNDSDGDSVPDDEDNCPFVPNPDQADTDGDGIGDACEPDSDGDGEIDDDDNCPHVPNPDQEDLDGNGIGDVCDGAASGDEIEIDTHLACNIISTLEATYNDPKSFTIGLPEDIYDILESRGYPNHEVDELFSIIASIELDLICETINGQESYSIILHEIESLEPGSITELSGLQVLVETANDLTGQIQYSATIHLINEEVIACEGGDLTIEEEEEEDEEENEVPDFPDLSCGDDFDTPDASSGDLEMLRSGDIIYMHGLPLVVSDANGSNGTFNVQLLIPLPFEDNIITTDFISVHVDENYVVTEGEIALVASADQLGDITELIVPLEIGSNYCTDPEEVSYGDTSEEDDGSGNSGNGGNGNDGDFGEGGIHSGTGTPYDWNGFDENGMHFSGNPYNEYGCSADGFLYELNPTTNEMEITEHQCDPSQEFSGIQGIIDGIKDLLRENITDAMLDIIANLNLEFETENSDDIRAALIAKFEELPADEKDGLRPFIFGDNNEYLNPGMHANFASEPQLPPQDNYRDETIKAIEALHVDLYHCDRRDQQITFYLELLDDQAALDDLEQFIIDEMSDWTEYEVTNLFDPNNAELFTPWLTEMIIRYFEENPADGFGAIEFQNINEIDLKKRLMNTLDFNNSAYFSTASMEYVAFDLNQHREAFEYEFNQGFREVQGINRAYILEEIAAVNNTVGFLPLKLTPDTEGSPVDIYLDNVRITPSSAMVDVYAIIKTGESSIVLEASDVTFTASGIESVTLELLSSIELKLLNPAKITIASGTSLTWTCGTVDQLVLNAEIEVCDRYIVPVNAQKEVITDEHVTFSISAQGSGWGEFYAEINSTHNFALTEYPSWIFTLNDIVIDNSSSENSELVPMEGYCSNSLISDQEGNRSLANSWKGFYLKTLEIDLPDDLKNNNPIDKIAFHNVLFDNQGASGQLLVTTQGSDPLLTKEQGNANGWAIGIDEFSVTVLKNNIAGFGIGGVIETPLMEEDFRYEGSMNADKTYSLYISADLEQPKQVPLFLASANLTDLSIRADFGDDGLQLSSTLSGSLNVDQAPLNSIISGAEITFHDLTIRNHGKKLEIEDWEFGTSEDLEIFGIKFEMDSDDPHGSFDIRTDYSDPNEVGFVIPIRMNFLEEMGITPSGSFDVIGRLDESEPLHKWRYDRFQLNQLCISGTIGEVVKLNNLCVTGYDIEGYGKGLRGSGSIELDLPALKLDLSVVAEFGSFNDSKYFFFDALVGTGAGVPVGPIVFDGFGGGISYGMEFGFDPSTINFASGGVNPGPTPGTTFTGGTYTPNAEFGLNIKAMTTFKLAQSEEVLNGSCFLSVGFLQDGGLDNIQFAGVANMLTGIDLGATPDLGNFDDEIGAAANADATGTNADFLDSKNTKPNSSGSISGYIYLKMDVANRVLTGDLKVFMNIEEKLRGAGDNYEVVNAKLKFAGFNDWYVNIGEPSADQSKLGGVKIDAFAGELDLYAYMDVGTSIPPFTTAHLPEKIRKFVEDNVVISEAFRQSGGGLMFGMGLNLNIHVNIWVGSADISAGAGFDVMMRKTQASCVGDADLVGVNGWYAMGQIWAYVDAGLKVAGVTVLNVGLYTVLNAQFPNPTLIQGAAQVKIRFLGSTLDKTVRFEIGEPCILQGETEESFEVISNLVPFDGTTEVTTDNIMEVNLALPNDDYIAAGNKIFHIHNLEYSITDPNNFEINCNEQWDDSNYNLYLTPESLLKANTDYTFEVNVTVDEYTVDGEFDPEGYLGHIVNGLSPSSSEIQTKSVTFTTGVGFPGIPNSNIQYAYPNVGMYDFYRAENAQMSSEPLNPADIGNGSKEIDCYVNLTQGQPDLMQSKPDHFFNKVIIESEDGKIEREFSYDYLNRQLNYQIPSDIPQGMIYKATFQFDPNDYFEDSWTDDPIDLSGLGSVETTGDEAYSGPTEPIVILEYYFRVSEYENFIDKIMAHEGDANISYPENSCIVELPLGNDVMDKLELLGNQYSEPLVDFDIKIKSGHQTIDLFDKIDFFNPFAYEEYIQKGLLSSYSVLATMASYQIDGTNPLDIAIEDYSSDDNGYDQTILINHHAAFRHEFTGFLNQLNRQWNGLFGEAENYARQQLDDIDGNTSNHYDICNANYPNGGTSYENCIIDSFTGSKKQFLIEIKEHLDTPLPTWNSNDKYNVTLRYLMPDGTVGSSYNREFPFNN